MKLNFGIYRACFLLLLFTVPVLCTRAQVNFQFMPALNGQSINGLFTAQLLHTGPAACRGSIKITVTDGKGLTVLIVRTPTTLIRPGSNQLQPLIGNSKIQFGNSRGAAVIAQTGRLPEDDYEYCFEFTGTEDKPNGTDQVFENCFNFSVHPVIPLSLLTPADGDGICNTRPGFSWQPAMPLVSSYRYRIVVVEKDDRQLNADAISNNTPVLQQDNMSGFLLPYPPLAPGLQKDKKYVWQVMVYEGSSMITRSEIWTFSIGCNDKKADSSGESYRQLGNILNGNYYIARGMLRFSLNNIYGTTKLQYTVTDIGHPTNRISNLPSIKVHTGLNRVDMPLDDVNGLAINKMYLLKIDNIGDHTLYLQFIYKEDEDSN